MRRVLASVFALLIGLHAATAQDRATLVADSVTVASGSTLLAEGHVEIYFKGVRLTATSIRYDQSQNKLVIAGPIRIDDGKGDVFLADQADLSADLSEGLLVSARLILDQRLQLAAAQIVRSQGGNLTALRRVAASSCTICASNPVPLWEIRASQVVHDAAAQQIYFTDAVLRFFGLPVMYLPTLRVPDPTMKRATGFLLPSVRTTSSLGAGIKIPYFIVLGPSRDLTLTPYFTIRGDKTLALRYREAFTHGTVEIDGAVTRDDLGPPNPRDYFQAVGAFDLGHDYALSFSAIGASDPSYLTDYGITAADQLDNQIGVTRVKRDLSFAATLYGFKSIRPPGDNSTLPSSITELTFQRRFTPAILGGIADVTLGAHGDYGASSLPFDSNGVGVAGGRNLARLSFGLNWQRSWTTENGMVISAMTSATADNYAIAEDTPYNGSPQQSWAGAGLELRWPFIKSNPRGISQLIEPVIQLVDASPASPAIPNGDSTMVELDEGNLFSLDRYPGADAVESGPHVNLGVNYRRDDPKGLSFDATAGRVVRQQDLGQFAGGSGLAGQKSDWLLAWSLANKDTLSLTNRLIIRDDLSLTKGELRFDVVSPIVNLSGGYEYLPADLSEDRPETASEIVLDAHRQLTGNWSADLNGRYDLQAQRLAASGLVLDFRNECISVSISLSRSYASSTSVTPSTDFGLSVELLGFGGGSAAGPTRVCHG